MASPNARAAVVEEVGARLSGHASFSTEVSSATSDWRARYESALPVSEITGTSMPRTTGNIPSSSSERPEYEIASNTSPRATMPKSPCNASVA